MVGVGLFSEKSTADWLLVFSERKVLLGGRDASGAGFAASPLDKPAPQPSGQSQFRPHDNAAKAGQPTGPSGAASPKKRKKTEIDGQAPPCSLCCAHGATVLQLATNRSNTAVLPLFSSR
jgi:hypothetical protein